MANKQDPFEAAVRKGDYKDGKLVGGYVSRQAAEYLRLLAIYKGCSIQAVLQEMVEVWMEQQEPRRAIIETLADRAYLEWQRRGLDAAGWKQYEAEVWGRLEKRKVPQAAIGEIVKEMRARVGKKNG